MASLSNNVLFEIHVVPHRKPPREAHPPEGQERERAWEIGWVGAVPPRGGVGRPDLVHPP